LMVRDSRRIPSAPCHVRRLAGMMIKAITSKSGRAFLLNSEEDDARVRKGIAVDPDTHELSDVEMAELRPLARSPESRIHQAGRLHSTLARSGRLFQGRRPRLADAYRCGSARVCSFSMIQLRETPRLVRRLAAFDGRSRIEPIQNPVAVGAHPRHRLQPLGFTQHAVPETRGRKPRSLTRSTSTPSSVCRQPESNITGHQGPGVNPCPPRWAASLSLSSSVR
jgi:hypothetical protein